MIAPTATGPTRMVSSLLLGPEDPFSHDELHTNTRILGDGRADLIRTDKYTGDGSVWYNMGQKDDIFQWEIELLVYHGSSRGPNIHFPNLGRQGGADMVKTDPTKGHVSFFPSYHRFFHSLDAII